MRKKRFFIPILVLLLLLAGCSIPVSPPLSYGDLYGYVYISRSVTSLDAMKEMIAAEDLIISVQPLDASGYYPLPDAKIRISGDNRQWKTDHSGYFSAKNVQTGYKKITVDHPFLRERFEKGVLVKKGETRSVGSFLGGVGYYLIIGIENYLYLDEAFGAVEDAREVDRVFNTSELGGYTKLLLDRNATKIGIRNAIGNITRHAIEEDYLVLYFAGRMGEDFLSPYDDSGSSWESVIKDSELESWLSAFPGDVTVILDGTESATFADGEVWPQALKKPKYTVLTSAKRDQAAIVHPNSLHGLFTHYLIEGLSEELYWVDQNRDGIITAKEIFYYIEDAMEDFLLGKYDYPDQQPDLWLGGGRDTVLFRYR